MAILDIVIIAFFVWGAVSGFMKGFIKQLATLLGIIVGLLAAKALYSMVAEQYISKITESATVAQIIAFVLIWIGVPLLFALFAEIFTRALEVISLGWLNRFLGAGLGALKFLILVSLLVSVFEFIDSDNRIVEKNIDLTKRNLKLLVYQREQKQELVKAVFLVETLDTVVVLLFMN